MAEHDCRSRSPTRARGSRDRDTEDRSGPSVPPASPSVRSPERPPRQPRPVFGGQATCMRPLAVMSPAPRPPAVPPPAALRSRCPIGGGPLARERVPPTEPAPPRGGPKPRGEPARPRPTGSVARVVGAGGSVVPGAPSSEAVRSVLLVGARGGSSGVPCVLTSEDVRNARLLRCSLISIHEALAHASYQMDLIVGLVPGWATPGVSEEWGEE